MKRKLFTAILSLATCVCCIGALSACTKPTEPQDTLWTMDKVYAQAQELGFKGTLEELQALLKGDKGDNGANGKDGIGITKAEINEKGELVLTYSNENMQNLGVISGKNGTDGVGITKAEINENGELILTYSNDQTKNLGKISGKDGKDGEDGLDGTNGKDGVGITKTEINENGELVLTYSNGESTNLGAIAGQNGKDGNGIAGAEINENGELVLTYSNGESTNLGAIAGQNGKDAPVLQNVESSARYDENDNMIFNFVFTFDDGSKVETSCTLTKPVKVQSIALLQSTYKAITEGAEAPVLEIEVAYSNGTSDLIPVTEEMIEGTIDFMTKGNYDITITYQGVSCEATIRII